MHYNPAFVSLLLISVSRSVTVNQFNLHTVTVINVKTWVAPSIRNCWNTVKGNTAKSFYRGRLDLLLVVTFKIIEIAKLAGLTDAFAVRESLVAVETQTIFHRCTEAHKWKYS